MESQYDVILRLTSPSPILSNERRQVLQDFSAEFGWHPSDVLEVPALNRLASSHLIVEHGLTNTAVITFLNNNRSYSELDYFEKQRLLNLSYNNLIDWHIQVEPNRVTYVYNRTKTPAEWGYSISRNNLEKLRSVAFQQATEEHPSPNVLALDDALISTISFWKRQIAAEMNLEVSNEELSALFNAIIFVRAFEDNERRKNLNDNQALLDELHLLYPEQATPAGIIFKTLQRFSLANIPTFLISEHQLHKFDSLRQQTIHELFSDFYRSKYAAPFTYDFSLMSKHALSRIYEHYVSILRLDESPQLSLPTLERLPQEEERDKAFGSIYTPQFIARFFAKYLRSQMPAATFRGMRTIDPAVGSGIFLRTLLEMQSEDSLNSLNLSEIDTSFNNSVGMDIDDNATQATRLSLSLLYLILKDSLPQALNIQTVNTLSYLQEHTELLGTFDTVIANPPFVSFGSQDERTRESVAKVMGEHGTGRKDTYLAFLRLAVDLLKPGGYGCFVLPHSFLLSNNARKIRLLLAETSWIRCLADLSAIRVFDNSGIYIILLIFQKQPQEKQRAPLATVIACQDLVGNALQGALDEVEVENTFYSIYKIDQGIFTKPDWVIVPPTEAKIKQKLDRLRTIGDFMDIRVGFNSGADNVFILPRQKLPKNERSIFVPYLQDKEIKAFGLPNETEAYVFYPYVQERLIGEEELKINFPNTWDYLISRRAELEKRAEVKKGNIPWWRPMRPREPENMLRPKIVSPHLVLVPRFAVDKTGKYAVRRSPLLIPRELGATDDLLVFFTAILNSSACYWYITAHSHTYRGGYVMLEPKTLKKTPVPDPSQVSPLLRRELLLLAEQESAGKSLPSTRANLDNIVADLYELTRQERMSLGIEK